MSGAAGYDRMLTVFSPEGRLYQIEYAFKAVKSSGLTSIGVRGDDAVVFITQKRVADKLVDASSFTHLFKITEHIGCVMTGLLPDAKAVVMKARQDAATFEFEYGYPIPVRHLARKLADDAQLNTQHAYKRNYAAVTILGAVDDEAGPQVFKVDPAGHVLGYKGTAAGVKEAEAANALEKKYKEGPNGGVPPLSTDDTIRLAITTMQGVLSSDFKAAEIEIAVVARGARWHVLTDTEVESHLTAIAERD